MKRIYMAVAFVFAIFTVLHAEQGIRLRATLQGHKDSVSCVKFVPGSNELISGSFDGTVALWDAEKGKLLGGFINGAPVEKIEISPDGKTLLTGGRDKTIRAWSLKTGVLLKAITGFSSMIYSLKFSNDGSVFAAGIDGKITLYKTSNFKELGFILIPGEAVRDMAFAFSDQYLAAASGKRVTSWDIKNKNIFSSMLRLDFVSPKFEKECLFSFPLVSISLSRDSQYAAVTGEDGRAAVTRRVDCLQLWSATPHEGTIWDSVYTPDGKYLVTAGKDGLVRFLDASSGAIAMTIANHTDQVYALAVSSDGRYLSSACRDRSIKIWEIGKGNSFTWFLTRSKLWLISGAAFILMLLVLYGINRAGRKNNIK